MSETKRNVPKLRFPGFTEDWEQRKLKHVVELRGRIGFRGYTEKDIISKEQGGILTFSPTNIIDDQITFNCKNTYITKTKYDESPEIKIINGDILFVKTGSILGKSALVMGLLEDATINPQIVLMRPKEINHEFLANMMINNDIMVQVRRSKIGGAVPTLTETNIKEFDIFIPTEKDELNKIGNIFKNINQLITLHQRKLENLKLKKKALLQKLFPKNGEQIPELRFPGFTDDWEQCKLSEVVNIRRGLTYKPSDISDSGIRVLRSSNIDEDVFVYNEEDVFVNVEAINIPCVKNGDILITAANGSSRLVGKHTIISGLEKNTAVHGGFMLLLETQEPQFIDALLSSSWYKKFINTFVAGGNGAIGNLNKSDLEEQMVYIPAIEEQRKIGAYYQSINNLITLHQRKYFPNFHITR